MIKAAIFTICLKSVIGIYMLFCSFRKDKIKKALRKSAVGSESGSEHSHSRDSTLLNGSQLFASLSTVKPPEKGILKKWPKSTDSLDQEGIQESRQIADVLRNSTFIEPSQVCVCSLYFTRIFMNSISLYGIHHLFVIQFSLTFSHLANILLLSIYINSNVP